MKKNEITIAGIILNLILFILKLSASLISGSLALLSDAFNSLTDIFSSAIIYAAVKVSGKKADKDHQFGHRRAEPIAALLVAIFAWLLGLQILREAIISLFHIREYSYEGMAAAVLVLGIVVKYLMYRIFVYTGDRERSPAIKASGIDARNDVLVSSIALIGILSAGIGFSFMDSMAAIVISVFIFYSGYRIGKENIDYLMGKCPPNKLLAEIRQNVHKVKGVKGIELLRAHYVGNNIHVEIHIKVDKKLRTENSHLIGESVQRAVEKLDYVDKAFIHIEPK